MGVSARVARGEVPVQFPTGSVVALSSAAATMFSMGMLFLGYWGLHEALPWRFGDYVVIVPALAGFACLASVPFLATSPMKTPATSRECSSRGACFCAAPAPCGARSLLR